jgi:hypothetical protein
LQYQSSFSKDILILRGKEKESVNNITQAYIEKKMKKALNLHNPDQVLWGVNEVPFKGFRRKFH